MSNPMMAAVAEAMALVPRITIDELKKIIGEDNVLVIDVRDANEVAAGGKIAGALHIPRPVLQQAAQPGSPSFNPAFSADKTIVLYCASGGRSALGGKALMELGYKDVRNLGAFKEWVAAGGAVESA